MGFSRLAVDADDNFYLAFLTTSADLVTTPGAFDTELTDDADIAVMKVAADGGTLLYSTFLVGAAASRPA